jgi:hypothetical protein
MDLKILLNEYLTLSDNMRAGYLKSLSDKKKDWKEIISAVFSYIPELYQVIYETVSGTKKDIAEQGLMDFIPGFRLIHIDELKEEKSNLDELLLDYDNPEIESVYPLLADYSSGFVCLVKMKSGEEQIGIITEENMEVEIMHTSAEAFLKTVCEFYKSGVYFLDEDEYLDYDFEKEGEVAAKLNEDVDYWNG